MNILQNDNLIVESKNSGAELTRIYSKKLGKDILWHGDSKFWGRRSPILFPIVGKLVDNETYIEGSTYSMGQHGFARDMDFSIVETTNNSVTYSLTSSEDSKKLYPYSFELIIKYTLVGDEIKIDWTVNNTDDKEIYFSIGAHPAFNLNFNGTSSLSDYYLEFTHSGNVDKISLQGAFSDKNVPVDTLDTIYLAPELFTNDALIYTNVNAIDIKSKNSDEVIKVNFNNFPLVGIWTPYYKETNSTAPFLCIEPWYGLADNVNTNKDFKTKNYINKLECGTSFTTSYSIIVG